MGKKDGRREERRSEVNAPEERRWGIEILSVGVSDCAWRMSDVKAICK